MRRALRSRLQWYPPDVHDYVVASQWTRIDQELPFVGRTRDRGDELGSRVITARLARDVMHLTLLLERQWSPYPKWLGTAYDALCPEQPDLDSEESLCAALDDLAGRPVTVPFWDRPFRTVDPAYLASLPPGLPGEPSDANAHPHLDGSGRIAVVHNGIIENAADLRSLLPPGAALQSETDTEVLAHVIGIQDHGELEDMVEAALRHVEGAYAIAVISASHPDRIVVARNGGPVLIGIGEREMFVASDAAAIVRHTDQVVHLDDGELAVVRAGGFTTATPKEPTRITQRAAAYDKGEHPHFMHKEIHEQPAAVERALRGRLDHRFATSHLGGIELSPRDVLALRRVKVLGCGSALYAGMYGARLVERLARIPADAEAASEFRHRNPIVEPDTLYVAVSQSGETFDTLAAVQEIQRKGGTVLGIVNTPGSTIARTCTSGIYLHAGPEVSVTSTKTFTATGVAFALLALHLGRVRDLGPADGRRVVDALVALPDVLAAALALEDDVNAVASVLAGAQSAFYVGRAGGYIAALEGAQKIKEVAYVHAEAYPASELKHGPLALVDEHTPTVVVVPDDELWEKSASTIAEIKARRGPVLAVTDAIDGPAGTDHVLRAPSTIPELAPLVLGVPLQLLAYRAAVLLGRDVDQPRNLAKSVTVE